MTGPLPPSKFGKGSTYGDTDHPLPAVIPPSSTSQAKESSHQPASSSSQHSQSGQSFASTQPPSYVGPPPHHGIPSSNAFVQSPYGIPQYGAPPHATRRSQRARLLLGGVAVTAFVAAAIGLVATGLTSSHEASSSSESSQPPAGMVSGYQDLWIESVCVTGSFVDGRGGLPGSTAGGLCRSRSGQGVINISQFDSDYKMRNAIAMVNIRYYVSGIEPDGTVIAFSTLTGGSADALRPLTQFGFTINTAPVR